MMDFTVQRRTEAVLEQALARAEEAQETKTRFLANVSHELRTPLTSIIGVAELLQDTQLDSMQQSFAATIERSGQRLLAIINELLDFSRTDAGFLALREQTFHLPTLLTQLEAEFSPLAMDKGLSFEVIRGPDVPSRLVADELRVAQVLQNLLGNAVKFTDSGGVRLQVRPSATEYGAAVEFAVVDSGIGFTEQTHAGLFEPLTQADDSLTRKYGGTGLGLAICRQLVQAMGGTINATSRPGSGSTFTFTLPLDPPTHQAHSTPCETPDGAADRRAPESRTAPTGHTLEVRSAAPSDESAGATAPRGGR